METLTRLVSESLARHGFDRPVDYRRLQWSRWFRCESHHSLLVVPSKPGVFALAEEVMSLGTRKNWDEHDCSRAERLAARDSALAAVPAEAQDRRPQPESPRMLAVSQFFEDDDMAFVLDRMLSRENPMRTRLASGRYFFRFVEIKDPTQRRSICNALNQWIISSAEKATGIDSHFATSLELTPRAEQPHGETSASPSLSAAKGGSRGTSDALGNSNQNEVRPTTAPHLNSAVDTTIHCSSSFPAGF
jgi:hypothetical protein